MPVRYNGSGLVPAPFIQMQEVPVRKEDGRVIAKDYIFNLNGVVVNVDTAQDSPGASGISNMEGTQGGQNYIRGIFGVEPALFEIESPNSSTNKCQAYCTVDDLTFQEGNWVNLCRYNVTLRARELIGVSGLHSDLESESENWSVTENEDGTYSVSHQIQARGRLIPTGAGTFNNPLDAARLWVRSRSYNTSTTGNLSEVVNGSGIMNLGGLINPLPSGTNYWNKSIIETVDPSTNNYSLSETFIYNPSGTTLEQYSISLSNESNNPQKYSVSINGSVLGFTNKISNHSNRFDNAKSYYLSTVEPNIYSRINNYVPGGFTLLTTPVNSSVTYEVTGNSVSYNRSYNAISGATLISNAIEESIEIADEGKQDLFAQIQIPGRSAGPLIQYMGTSTARTRTVTINATLNPSGTSITQASLLGRYLSKPNTDAIVGAFVPSAGYYYVSNNSENWNIFNYTYSRTMSWVIDASGIVNGSPSGIHNLSP
jgi:hypothetical protein